MQSFTIKIIIINIGLYLFNFFVCLGVIGGGGGFTFITEYETYLGNTSNGAKNI